MADPAILDHLAVACRSLDEGTAWLAAKLGMSPDQLPDQGGRHPQIGTHNRLLSLGSDGEGGEYLELIAIDPDGITPGFPRWFGLDDFNGPPRLVGWVARTSGALDQPGASPRDFSRDALRWRFSLPDDGMPLDGGVTPALIDWQGSPHPAPRLPDLGLRLLALDLSHPAPLPALPVLDPRITLRLGPAVLRARILTPKGETEL